MAAERGADDTDDEIERIVRMTKERINVEKLLSTFSKKIQIVIVGQVHISSRRKDGNMIAEIARKL
ncbi:hypothetical protein NC980_00040 [Leptolyngbya sp. AS-A5]